MTRSGNHLPELPGPTSQISLKLLGLLPGTKQNDALVNGCKIVSPLGKSDYVGILFELVVSPKTDKSLKEKMLKPTNFVLG